MANTRLTVNKLIPPASLPTTTNKTMKVVTPPPSKQVEFEKDLEKWIINEKETFYEFLLELLKSNLETYRKLL